MSTACGLQPALLHICAMDETNIRGTCSGSTCVMRCPDMLLSIYRPCRACQRHEPPEMLNAHEAIAGSGPRKADLVVQRLDGGAEGLHAAHGRPHQHPRPRLLYVP